jgi:hypothetical protein
MGTEASPEPELTGKVDLNFSAKDRLAITEGEGSEIL